MDWKQISETANQLLITFGRFSAPEVDLGHLLNVANDGNPGWAADAAMSRRMYQALDLLAMQSIMAVTQHGTVSISDRGRAALGTPKESWLPNPNSPQVAQWMEMEDLQEASDRARPQSELTLSRLRVSNWRQFEQVDVTFHPRLTILTGANAAGKTTILNLLAPHFNWQAQFVSRGRQKVGQETYASNIGELRYSNGVRSQIFEPPTAGVSMANASYNAMQSVPGIFISSHRSMSGYRPLDSLPARFSEASTMLGQFAAEVQSRYSGGTSQFSPLFRMKEALVSAALHGYGNQVVRQTPSAIRIWEGFQTVLMKFLPRELGFSRLVVENGDLIFATASGDFPLEAASGGLSAMLELSWQIFLRSQDAAPFTVCIDEPENHLHPELQRLVVPALLDAFPSISLIVATHSPFVITSTRDCVVYVLARNENDSRVRSYKLDDVNASGTADETLQRVLGLDTPLPLWVQSALTAAIDEVPPNANAEDLRQLRARLSEIGLERQFPAAISAIRDEDR